MNAQAGKNVVVGVTGGIAAYKAVELVREFQKRQYEVRVVLTKNACEFVGRLTFESLTRYPVIIEMFESNYLANTIQHTSLSDWADFVVIAPATANIIGKYAHGIADDFLSTFLLACDKPVLIAPAMNPRMYNSPAVQENITLLENRNVYFTGPETGKVACGHQGPGRMSEPVDIADVACSMPGRESDLTGIRILVSAGPTREMIDPVRFLSNRSSGKMGYAVANAAAQRGATVTLVSGPVTLKPNRVVRHLPIVSADEMCKVIQDQYTKTDILIMSAAVADWKVASQLRHKWKKSGQTATLNLVRTRDILHEISKIPKEGKLVAGFAAETENFLEEGKRKLKEKNLDLILVNDVSLPNSGFGTDENCGTIIDSNGNLQPVEICSKFQMANILLSYLLKLKKDLK